MASVSWLLTGSGLLLLVSLITAYQNGAPRSSCESLSPAAGHQGEEISTLIPHSIELEQGRYTYSPGEVITVTITSVGTVFTGLLLQARLVVSYEGNKPITKKAAGHFAFPHRFTNLRTMNCWSKSDSITQVTPYRNLERVSLQWIPPNYDAGEIVFEATVMRDQHKWYTGLKSYVIRYAAKSTLPPPASSSLQPISVRPSDVVMSSGNRATARTLPFHLVAAIFAALATWIHYYHI